MGIFDGLFGYTQEEIDKAYNGGVEEAKKEGIFTGLAHEMANLVAGPFMDDAAKARERGRQDYLTGKKD